MTKQGTSAFFTGIDQTKQIYWLFGLKNRCCCSSRQESCQNNHFSKDAAANPPPYEVSDIFTEIGNGDLDESSHRKFNKTVTEAPKKRFKLNKNIETGPSEKADNSENRRKSRKRVWFNDPNTLENIDSSKPKSQKINMVSKKMNTKHNISPNRKDKASVLKEQNYGVKPADKNTKNLKESNATNHEKNEQQLINDDKTAKAHLNTLPNRKDKASVLKEQNYGVKTADKNTKKLKESNATNHEKNEQQLNNDDKTAKAHLKPESKAKPIKSAENNLKLKSNVKLSKKNRCREGICVDALKKKDTDFICKCEKRRQAFECNEISCKRYPSSLESSTTIDKLKRTICCLCRKCSRKQKQTCERGVCRVLQKKNEKFLCNCAKGPRECSDETCTEEKTFQSAYDQTGEPLLEMKLNAKDMTVINSSHLIDKVKSLGKRVKSQGPCVCPSHGNILSMYDGKNVCRGGTCDKLMKNKKTNFTCKCLEKKIVHCSEDICKSREGRYTNKKAIKGLRTLKARPQIKPLLEVRLNPDNFSVINSDEVEEKMMFLRMARGDNICPSGICNDNLGKRDVQTLCTCNPHQLECNYKTCKISKQNSETYCSKLISQICRKRRKSSSSKWCRGLLCSKSDNTNDGIKFTVQNKNRPIPADSRKHHIESPQNLGTTNMKTRTNNTNVTTPKKACGDIYCLSLSGNKSTTVSKDPCACCVCSTRRKCFACKSTICSSITAFLKRRQKYTVKESDPMKISNKHITREPQLVKVKKIPEEPATKVVQVKQIPAKTDTKTKRVIVQQNAVVGTKKTNKRVVSEVNPLPKPSLKPIDNTCLCHHECHCKAEYKKMKSEQKSKKKSKPKPKKRPKPKPKKSDDPAKKRKAQALAKKKQSMSEEKAKRSQNSDKKYSKAVERKEKAARKKQEKIQRQQLKELEAQMRGKSEVAETSCCAECLLGVLELAASIITTSIYLVFRLLTEPKLSFMYLKMRLKDPVGTCTRMKRWSSDKWQLKKMKMQRSMGGSETMTVLSDTLKETPVYQAFSNKGRTKREKQEIEAENKRRKARIRKRDNEAVYGCRHMLLTTLRRTPCLWVYHICPGCYPQCLSFLAFIRNFSHLMLFCLAVVCWTPCILMCEMCRAFMCCFLCTA